MAKTTNRTRYIVTRLSEAEHDMLRTLAAREQAKMSEVLRGLIRAASREREPAARVA